MGSLFGKPHKPTKTNETKTVDNRNKVDDKDRAILELKNARDRLKKYKKKVINYIFKTFVFNIFKLILISLQLDIETTKLQQQIIELVRSKQQNKAILLLKIKKHKLKAADNIDNQLLSLFQMIQDVEWSSINVEVLNALKKGNNELNKIHNEMSLDDITAILDDTNEAIEIENQINKLLGSEFSTNEDELLRELDLLGTTTIETTIETVVETAIKTDELKLPEVPDSIILPKVPKHEIEVTSEMSIKSKNNEKFDFIAS